MSLRSAAVSPGPQAQLSSAPVDVTVATHYWQGYRFFSRIRPSPSPQTEPIVLIGGAFQRKEQWGRLETELASFADVVTVDLPGWGAADTLPARYGTNWLAEATAQLLYDLDLPHVNLFGGSYGSAIAYQVAGRYPHLVRRTILLGATTRLPGQLQERAEKTLRLLESGDRDAFARDAVSSVLASPPGTVITRGRAVERLLTQLFSSLQEEDIAKYRANTMRLFRGELINLESSPPQPTLVVTGEHDRLTPPAEGRLTAQSCQQAWFTSIKDCNHMLHLQRTTDFAELIRRFVTQTASQLDASSPAPQSFQSMECVRECQSSAL